MELAFILATLIAVFASLPWSCLAANDQQYILVRQYTPTFCDSVSSQPCTKGQEPELMTIHGLWPSGMTYDDKSPSYCTNEKFSTSKLTSTTLKRMDCAWISSTGSNEGFWSYEWSKHGTCADFPTQEAYFQAALDANDKYDLNVAFQEAGISFSNDRAPTVSELQAAMRSSFGVGGQVIKCDSSSLYEIYMCLNWETLEAYECDSSYWNTCGSEGSTVNFPQGSGAEAATCTSSPTAPQKVNGSGQACRAPSRGKTLLAGGILATLLG